MFTAKKFRAKAAECAESLKQTDIPNEVRNLQQSRDSFTSMADNEEWLEANFDKIVHSQDARPEDVESAKPAADAAIAQSEERILRCLGAAVIMQWNTIPTKLRRELFDTAGAMGDVLQSTELRAQIARFLHKQKNGDSAAARVAASQTPKGPSDGAQVQ